jgi:anti-sigma B factor antagonist
MKISQKSNGEIEVMEVTGEVDFHSSPELRRRLHEVVNQRIQKIVVDLKAVKYIDSSGLATFVEALQKIKRYNGRLILSELNTSVRSVFEIAKLDRVFQLAGSQEEAYHFLSS